METRAPALGACGRVTARVAPSTEVGMTCRPSTLTVTWAGSVVVTPPPEPSTMGPLKV